MQHGVAREQTQVLPVHRQRTRVVTGSALGIPGVVKEIGLRLVDVDHARDVLDPVEGLFRPGDIVLLEEHSAEVDVDIRGQRLAKAHQTTTVNQLAIRVAAPGVETPEAGARRRESDEFAEDGRSPDTRLGQRVLQGAKHPLGVPGLLRDVGQQPVEVELVVVARDAFKDHSLGPMEDSEQIGRQSLAERTRADHVDDAVHGDDEGVVVRGVFRRVLQHRHGFVPAPDALHAVRHQQQVVAVLGVSDQRPTVALDRFSVETAQGQDAGFELAADTRRIQRMQSRKPALYLRVAFVAFLGEIVGQQVQDEVLHMLRFIVRVLVDQLAEHPVVARVVVVQPVDIGQPSKPLHGIDPGGPREFLDDLGRRQRVAHFGVDAYQEIHLVAVHLARNELLFELHDDVGEGVRFRRQEQKLILGETAPGRVVDADPEGPPGVESVLLAVGKAVEPGEPHALVVAQAVLGGLERFHDLKGQFRPIHAFVGVGEIAHGAVLRGQERLQAREDRQRIVVPASFEACIEQEQQPLDVFAGFRHLPLDHRNGFLEESHADHLCAGGDDRSRTIPVGCLEEPPHGERVLVAGETHVVRRQTGVPEHDIGLRGHEATVFADHVVGSAGGVVELDEPPPGFHVDTRAVPRNRFVECDGVVVALRLDEEIDPQFVEHGRSRSTSVETIEEIRQGVLFTVRFDEQRQGVAGVDLQSGRFEPAPGFPLGDGVLTRRKRPLSQPHVFPVHPGRIVP